MLRSRLESTRRSLTDGLFIMPAAGLLMLALALPSMAQEFVNVTHGRAQFWSFSQGMVAQDFDQTAEFASASLVSDDGESTATVMAQGSVAGATTMMVDTSLDRSSVNIAVGKASIHLYRPLAFGPFEYGSEFEVTLNGSITGTATGDEVGPLTFASEFFSERVTQAGFRLFNEIGFAVPGSVSGSGLHGGGVVDGTSDVLLTGIHDPIDESFVSTWLIRVPFPDEVGLPDDFQFGPLWLNSRLDTLFGTVNAGTEVDAAISVTLTTDLDILPPIADAGGPYVVTSGETVTLDASGTSGDIEVFEWDFDFGESFDVDAMGQFPVFDASGIEAPAQRNIALRVRDVNNLTALDTTLLTIEPPEVFEWINTQGGSFENGDNWSGGEKPGSQNTAHFNAPGSYTVDVGTETVDRLIIGGDPSFNVTIQTLLLEAGSTSQDEPSIQVNNGHFTLGGGFLTGNHMVIGDSAATETVVSGQSSDLLLNGLLTVGEGGEATLVVENSAGVIAGEIRLAAGSAPANVSVVGGNGSARSSLKTEGLMAIGFLGSANLNVLAGGVVEVGAPGIATASLGVGFAEEGTLTVSGQDAESGHVSTLRSHGNIVVGGLGGAGMLHITDGGVVEALSDALIGVAAGGEVNVNGAVDATVRSRLEVQGLLTVGDASTGVLTIAEGGYVETKKLTISLGLESPQSGTGTVNVQGSTNGIRSTLMITSDDSFIAVGADNPGQLNIHSGGLVESSQRLLLGANGPGIASISGVDASSGEPSLLSLERGFGLGFNGLGEMTISDGGRVSAGPHPSGSTIGLLSPGTVTVEGTSGQTASTLEVTGDLTVGVGTEDSSVLAVSNGAEVIVSGQLIVEGLGAIVGNNGSLLVGSLIDNGGLINNGLIGPGASPGSMTIVGDLVNGPAGTLEIEIAGTTPGEEHDQLVVTGDAVVEGNVVLKFMDGFAPTAGQEFGALLDVRGAADTDEAYFIVQNLAGDFEYDITPMENGFMLTALTDGTFQQAIPGDYDNSGQVEQADLDLVLLNWGASATPIPSGWINDLPSGNVDQAELDQVLLNWGDVAPQPETTNGAVPEPATWAMMLTVGLLGFFFSRGIRRRDDAALCRRVERAT